MNLDFSAEPLFSWYVVLLFVSGIAMIGIGAVNFGGLSTGWRIFNAVAGAGFVGYAFYLAFIFEGGSYILFFKAFILPVLMVINFVRSLANRRQAAAPVPYARSPYAQAPQAAAPTAPAAAARAEPAAGSGPVQVG
ncbi:hypothetical protein [Kitasatospora sp. NPDC059571]|uniref:hypothetical protein n=1 Tax=Kitasatospora sp. NPDC059571 TaxID=3346871 RepID=UPI0036B108D7